VGDEEDGLAPPAELADLVEALVDEGLVPHRQDLVDEENVRVHVDGDGEAEPHVIPEE
jgi:hypothetical protein